MQNSKHLLVRVMTFILLAGGINNAAMADSNIENNSAYDLTVRRLESIQAETVVYEAQVARAKARKELENNGTDISSSIPSGRSGVDVSVISSNNSSRNLPRIQEIYGSQSSLMARLILPDGSVLAASGGQKIPGTTWTVKSITGRSVSVSDGTQERQLSFQ